MKKETELLEVDEKKVLADETITDQDDENKELYREPETNNATISNLKQELTLKDEEIAGLKSSLSELRSESEGLSESLTRAVTAYRELVLQTNPGVLTEFIKGSTIEEINESFKNARVLVDKLRQEIEAETAQTRIPAGAPQRSAQDISILSPREKIQRALAGLSS